MAAAGRRTALVKTGLMVGLGETAAEVDEVLRDAAAAGVDLVTIGQYLQPRRECLPVARYVEPAEFASWQRRGAELGLAVTAAPFVRSSYRAGEALHGPAADQLEAPHGPAAADSGGSPVTGAAGLLAPDCSRSRSRPRRWSCSTWTSRCCAPATCSRPPGTAAPASASGCGWTRRCGRRRSGAPTRPSSARRELTGDAHDDGLLDVIARALIEGLGGGDPAAMDAAVAAVADAWAQS